MDHVLTTERLVLRPVTADDQVRLLAHWTLPDVRRFLFDGAALSAAEVAATLEESVGDFAAAGYGVWLIQEQDQPGPAGPALGGSALADPGTPLVGTAGLRPLGDLGLEIFYSLAPGSWGRGYATEAARAVVDHALSRLGLPATPSTRPGAPQEATSMEHRCCCSDIDAPSLLFGPALRGGMGVPGGRWGRGTVSLVSLLSHEPRRYRKG